MGVNYQKKQALTRNSRFVKKCKILMRHSILLKFWAGVPK